MNCLKCGATMLLESTQTKNNKISKEIFRCPKCGDRIVEDEENKWVKF